MRKTFVIVLSAVLALALCTAGVAAAVGNGQPPSMVPSSPPAEVPDRPSVHLVDSPATTVPRGPAPEFLGKPNRERVPEHTGQRMTDSTVPPVRFR